MNFTFSLLSLLKNDIARTGMLLGAFGGILVLILAFVHFFATDAIAEAKARVEERARNRVYQEIDSFSPKAVYLLEASQSQAVDTFVNVFNNIKKHPDQHEPLDLKDLAKNKYIEFLVLKKNKSSIPNIINIINFENDILKNINEKDKSDILTFYSKKTKENSYVLKSKLNKLDRSKISYILKSVRYIPNLLILTKKQHKILVKKLKKHKIKIISYYSAFEKSKISNLKLKGWVVRNSASGGYGGNINMLIGFTKKKKMTGYLMVDHNETPGLGVIANEEKFVSNLTNAFNKVGFTKKYTKLDTKKDFKDYLGFDSISGATITSVAVANGIAEAFNKLKIKIDALNQINPFELPKIPKEEKKVEKANKIEKAKKIELAKKRDVAKKRFSPKVNKRSGELQLRPPKHESGKPDRTKEENNSALEKLLKEQ